MCVYVYSPLSQIKHSVHPVFIVAVQVRVKLKVLQAPF